MKRLWILMATMAAAIGLGAGCRTMEGGSGPVLESITENDVRSLIEKVFAASQRGDLKPIPPSLTEDFTMTFHDPDQPRPAVLSKKEYVRLLAQAWEATARSNKDAGSEIVQMHITVAADGQSAETVRLMRSWHTRRDTGVQQVATSEYRNQLRLDRGVLRISRLEIFAEPSGLSSSGTAGRANEGL